MRADSDSKLQMYGYSDIVIGDNSRIGRGTRILADRYSKVVIGNNVVIENNCLISSRDNTNIYIGDNVCIKENAHIDIVDGAKLDIGEYTTIAENVDIRSQRSEIVIGRDCLLSYGIKIRGDNGHTLISDATNSVIKKARKTFIGNHVWCGMGAIIMCGSRVGDNSVIGAGSVVNSLFDKGSLIVGVPAKMKKSNMNWNRTPDYL